MPFTSTRAKLSLPDEDKVWLQQLSVSRSESVARVQRAQILLRYHQGHTVSAIAAELHSNRPKVERCIGKALELGFRAALKDLPGRGRRVSMTDEDRAWVVSLACQKPKDLGYAQELWNTRLLAEHITETLSGGRISQSTQVGERHGVQNPGNSSGKAAQDSVLSGTA